jgi:hypothetical protein
MTRHDRAAALRADAALLRHDAEWMTEACAGKEPLAATWLKLGAACLEFRAMLWRWPR